MTYTMTQRVRKLALTTHITVSVSWIGGVVAYLALVIAALNTQDVRTIRAAWIGMELIGWYVLVPLAFASLVTGLVMGLGTRWGLFRHYWVLISLILTILATIILFNHMQDVSQMSNIAVTSETAIRDGLQSTLLHAVVGLLALLVITVLNVYKPRGMTPYGQRKLEGQRKESQPSGGSN